MQLNSYVYVYVPKHLYVVKFIILRSAIWLNLYLSTVCLALFSILEIRVWQHWTFKTFQITVRVWFDDKNALFFAHLMWLLCQCLSNCWQWHILMIHQKKKMAGKTKSNYVQYMNSFNFTSNDGSFWQVICICYELSAYCCTFKFGMLRGTHVQCPFYIGLFSWFEIYSMNLENNFIFGIRFGLWTYRLLEKIW